MAKATRQQSKQHNTRLILKTIYEEKTLSRADLARQTDLTRPTVSTIVNDLIKRDLIYESGIGESTGGKRPILVQIAKDAHQMLCIDISGRRLRGALVNLRGEVTERIESPNINLQGEQATAEMFSIIDRLIATNNTSILGIGVGTPGLFNPHTGIVHRAINLNWEAVPLQKLLDERYDYPIHIANDSQVAAMGQLAYTPSGDSQNLILLKMGRGIGAGILMNGTILQGDGYGTGEIGHVVIAEQNDQLLTLESVASSQFVLDKIREIMGNDTLVWNDINPTLLENDEIAQLVETVGHYLGIMVANMIAIVNIHHIVISGRLSQFGDRLLEKTKQTALNYGLKDIVEATTISYSELGSDIVLLGCSALILKNELGIL